MFESFSMDLPVNPSARLNADALPVQSGAQTLPQWPFPILRNRLLLPWCAMAVHCCVLVLGCVLLCRLGYSRRSDLFKAAVAQPPCVRPFSDWGQRSGT